MRCDGAKGSASSHSRARVSNGEVGTDLDVEVLLEVVAELRNGETWRTSPSRAVEAEEQGQGEDEVGTSVAAPEAWQRRPAGSQYGRVEGGLFVGHGRKAGGGSCEFGGR